jgi:hypothetical protein
MSFVPTSVRGSSRLHRSAHFQNSVRHSCFWVQREALHFVMNVKSYGLAAFVCWCTSRRECSRARAAQVKVAGPARGFAAREVDFVFAGGGDSVGRRSCCRQVAEVVVICVGFEFSNKSKAKLNGCLQVMLRGSLSFRGRLFTICSADSSRAQQLPNRS